MVVIGFFVEGMNELRHDFRPYFYLKAYLKDSQSFPPKERTLNIKVFPAFACSSVSAYVSEWELTI